MTDKSEHEESLDELIKKENKLNSIVVSSNQDELNTSLDIYNPKKIKGEITTIHNIPNGIGLEIEYNNTSFCKIINIPNENNVQKSNYIIFKLLDYYDIPNRKFLDLIGKKVYIIKSEITEDKYEYEISLPSNDTKISNKLFYLLHQFRKYGLIDIYNTMKNKTKIKIEPVVLFPLFISMSILLYIGNFISSILSTSVSDNSYMYYLFNSLSIILGGLFMVTIFYLCILIFFLTLNIIDNLIIKYIIHIINKHNPL